MTLKEAVIVSAARTPVGKAKRGSLVTVRPDELGSEVVKELMKRTPALDPSAVDDVIFGCAFPEGEQGMNMARMISLRSGLPIRLTMSSPWPARMAKVPRSRCSSASIWRLVIASARSRRRTC